MSYVFLSTREEYSLQAVRAALPNTLIPEGADLSEFGYAPLIALPAPELPAGHKLVRTQPFQGEDGQWLIGWDSLPLTDEEIEADRIASVPRVIQRRQGRLALRRAGMLSAVEAAIAAVEGDDQRMDAQIEYEADTWELGNPFLQTMWSQLGGTPRELDDLFMYASTL